MTPKASKAWAKKICAAWQRSIDSIFECGRLLIAAKARLEHGTFQKMVKTELPFGPSTAERLMKIARDERLTNPAHAQLLPANWYTLYELSKLSDSEFQAALADGKVRPDMQRADVAGATAVTLRTTFEDVKGATPYTVPELRPTLSGKAVVVTEAAPARAFGPVKVETVETGSSYWSDPTTFHAGDRSERVINTLEMLAADPAVADKVVKTLQDDGERRSKVTR